MKNEDFILLLHKRWTGSISPSEEETLKAYLASSEAARKEAMILESVWKNAAQAQTSFNPKVEPALARFKKRMHKPARIILLSLWPKAALAASVALLVGGLVFSGLLDFSSTKYAAKESMEKVELPDGTIVYLNKNSRLTFRQTEEPAMRIAKLDGEGYFHVTSDEQNPFIVETPQGSRIRVTGTVFNIRAYKKDYFVETYLESGRVEYLSPNGAITRLKPSHKIQHVLSTDKIEELPESQATPVFWFTENVNLKKVPLRDALDVIERRYNIKFDRSAIQLSLNCIITIDLTTLELEEAIDELTKIAELEILESSNKAFRLARGQTCR